MWLSGGRESEQGKQRNGEEKLCVCKGNEQEGVERGKQNEGNRKKRKMRKLRMESRERDNKVIK